eukprot:GHVL01038867.1.p1 GENE.GHVL01038867.1~~GHVL01038867.1.p1  ORF type:complete len:605 (-),score=107.99 GHVL01038867.1:489-2303(-)
MFETPLKSYVYGVPSIVDYYSTLDEVPTSPHVIRRANSKKEYNSKYFHSRLICFWILLLLLGVITALVSFSMDLLIEWLGQFHQLLHDPRLNGIEIFVLMIFIGICGFVATWSCDVLSAAAAGSGIPEIKTILSGIEIENFLCSRALIAKVIGLVAGVAGGLSLGKEGPFVHISAIVVTLLNKLHIFKFSNVTMRNRLLGVAVAVGVTATFGAPVGGLLFSIEVTSTFFFVDSLWKSFFCCVCCVLSFRLLRTSAYIDLFDQDAIATPIAASLESFAFVILGILTGVLGSCATSLITCFSRYGTYIRGSHRSNKYIYTCVIMLALSMLHFLVPFLGNKDRSTIKSLFSDEDMNTEIWNNSFITLPVFVFVKTLSTALSLSCPIPCGVFTPIFVIGASFGRMYGTFLKYIIPSISSPGVYAFVGAAALTAAVTRTLSVTIILFELTGQLNHFIPVLLSVLGGYATASLFSVSIYDSILHLKKLPFLPAIHTRQAYRMTATDFYESIFDCMIVCGPNTSIECFKKALLNTPKSIVMLPLTTKNNKLTTKNNELTIKNDEYTLIGCMDVCELRNWMENREDDLDDWIQSTISGKRCIFILLYIIFSL